MQPRRCWGARASDQGTRQALALRVQRLPKRLERWAGDRLPQQRMQGLTVLYALDSGRNIVRRLSKMRRDGFQDHRPRLLHLPLLAALLPALLAALLPALFQALCFPPLGP